MIGFRSSALARCAAGLGFCGFAVLLVWWVEREPARAPMAPPQSAVGVRGLALQVESTYPVARWQVQVLGRDQAAAASDAWSWHGLVQVPSGEDVVVTGFAATTEAAPHRGLRLRLGDAPERIVWGAGDVVATGTAP